MFKFKKNSLSEFYRKNGYAVVNIFDSSEVDELRKLYLDFKSKHLTHQNVLHSTVDTENERLIRNIHDEIAKRLEPALGKLMFEYDLLLSGFLVKNGGGENRTAFHQDPTRVDEHVACSANVWIPLQSVDDENGNLVVVPGTHRLNRSLRVAPACPVYYSDFVDKLDAYSISIPLKLGQAVILDHSILHGSTSNTTQTERIAIVAAIKSDQSTPWLYYYKGKNSSNTIEKFRLDTESFSRTSKNYKPPESYFVESFEYEFEKIRYYDFLKFMKKEFNNVSFIELLKSRFQ